MEELKKVVDLILVEPQKDPKILLQEMKTKINIWSTKLKELQDRYFESNFDSAGPDVQEVMAMRRLLSKFIRHRVDWIETKVTNPLLQKEYLKVLPPFPQKGGIKTLLLHFFQIAETEDKKSFCFAGLNDEEKEIRILWDLYKLMKTIEAIDVILEDLKQPEPFPSLFTVDERVQMLNELKVVFRLMFQMTIQPQYQKELYRKITPELLSAEAILERKAHNIHYVYPHVLKKFDYRNHFFFIYFYDGMKAKVKGNEITYTYNYLNFEILKQEFLIHWMKQKLADNPNKLKIYSRYRFGHQSLAELVSKNPEREIELLKQMPINLFNDLTAQVNQVVGPEAKTPVEAMSEEHGEFAEMRKSVSVAKKLAQSSLEKLKLFVGKKKTPTTPEPAPKKEPVPEPEAITEPEPTPEYETTYEVIKIKKKEIDFPFLTPTIPDFAKHLNLIRAKMGNTYKEFYGRSCKLLGSVSESAMIQQRTPKHEWVMPFLILEKKGPETVQKHLLIIGAEIKAKQLGMGYGAAGAQSTHQMTPYFVYAALQPDATMGPALGQRNVRGEIFTQYGFSDSALHERVMHLFNITEQK